MEAYLHSSQLLDYRDAIRSNDPIPRSAGLTLDFVSRMVSSPVAIFLAIETGQASTLAVVKADPTLGSDAEALGREYLRCVEGADPLLEAANLGTRLTLIGTDGLEKDSAFGESRLSTSFLREYGLGPVVALYLRNKEFELICVLVLIRSADEPEFTDREKSFLRQAAPVLAQSHESAAGARAVEPEQKEAVALLTPREQEIAQMAAAGARNEQIAKSLHISPGTVKTHMRNIYSKLGVDSRVHLSLSLTRQ